MGTSITPRHGDSDKRWNRSQLVPIEFKSDPSHVTHTLALKLSLVRLQSFLTKKLYKYIQKKLPKMQFFKVAYFVEPVA